MRIRCPLALAGLALLWMPLAGHAQSVALGATARYVAQGLTGIAGATDAGAVALNPATLSQLDMSSFTPRGGTWEWPTDEPWRWQMQSTGELSGELNHFAFNFALRERKKHEGFGLSFRTLELAGIPSDNWLLGYGRSVDHQNWSWGLAFGRLEPEGLLSAFGPRAVQVEGRPFQRETALNGGLLFTYPQPHGAPVKVGVTAMDLINATGRGPLWGVGVTAPLSPEATLSVDYLDVTDEVFASLNAGLQARVNDNWYLRAGAMNLAANGSGDPLATAGLGYRSPEWWSADLAWMDLPSGLDDEWGLTVSYTW